MGLYITLDVSAIYSKAVLWRDDKVLSEVGVAIGARDTVITGSSGTLARAAAGSMAGVCLKAGVAPEAVDQVIATGMISSSLGLLELPLLVVPTGIGDLAAGMVSELFPEVWYKPIWMIPGIKNKPGVIEADDLPQMDMMRGEEVEIMALLDRLSIDEACWIIIPGMNSKFTRISKNGRIMMSISTISGELFDALANHTSIALAVDVNSEPDLAWLKKGYLASMEYGISRAAYCVRMGQLWSNCVAADRAAYLMGAVLAGDVSAFKALKVGKTPIYIAGRGELRSAFVELFTSAREFKTVRIVDSALLANLSGWGALLVARERGCL
jgi:2-dehydro-3-deoxygalactonokinase